MATKSKTTKKPAGKFRLTYSTMFNPPEDLHTKYDKSLASVKAGLGRDHAMMINGQDRFVADKFEDRSPINTDWLLGTFQKGSAQDAKDAIGAAEAAWPKWAGMKWKDRVRLLRKAAANIEKRVFEIGAVMSLEVGKNRMEASGVKARMGTLGRALDIMRALRPVSEREDGDAAHVAVVGQFARGARGVLCTSQWSAAKSGSRNS